MLPKPGGGDWTPLTHSANRCSEARPVGSEPFANYVPDRLYAMFAAAFLLLGLTRFGLAMSDNGSEGNTSWYWVRLIGFLIILVAIADKNRR